MFKYINTKKIKNLIFCIFTLILSNTALSEDLDYQRVAVEAKKKLQIAKNMQFTKQQDKAFWALYSEYERDLDDVYRDKFDLVQDFKNANASRRVTDQQANQYLENFFEIENRKLLIKQGYIEKFQKILPGKKVARFYKIDNKLDAIINNELAIKVNLLE
ncbi:MAG: hypothetical protein OEQ24_11170 [Gammaproteobacteria bacterium]|nr:hypothetical protein [Gammaproteobacteria bacterium]